MKCLKCGSDIQEDLVYCPNCGQEIQYVPEFEPEIEQSIRKSMSDIVPEVYEYESDAKYDSPIGKSRQKHRGNYEKSSDGENRRYKNSREYAETYDDTYQDSTETPNGLTDTDFIDIFEEKTISGQHLSKKRHKAEKDEEESGNSGDFFRTKGHNNIPPTGTEEDYETQSIGTADASEEYHVQSDYEELTDYDESLSYEESADYDESLSYEESADYDESLSYEELSDYDESLDHNEDYSEDSNEDYIDYDEEYLDEFDEEYDGEYEDDDFDEEDEDIPLLERFQMLLKSTKNRVIFIILAVVLLVGIVFAVIYVKNFSKNMVENNSYSYQASLARQSALSGDYQTAITYMEKALALNSSDSTMKYDLAQYYFKNNESEKAILILWEIIYGKENGYENAYALILDYYINLQDYKMVKQILDNCESTNVLKKYTNYLANAPEFSEAEGTYEDVVYLKLSSASAGTIYYTMDGTEPTLESNVYIEPLVLELGKYTINAFFVNSYGIASDCIKMSYIIDIRVPDAPKVLLEEGEYTVPMLIKAEAQKFCSIHYTTDGSSPTIDSPEYTGPIPMPLGVCQFTFAAFTQDGVCGDLAEVTYSLILDSEIQISDIIANLQQYNLNMGKTSNLQGLMLNGSSVYSYIVSSAIALDNNGKPIDYDANEEDADTNTNASEKTLEGKCYYIIVETLVDINNIAMKTGTIYLADAETGDLYKANKEEETNLPILGEQISPELYAPIGNVVSGNEVLPQH